LSSIFTCTMQILLEKLWLFCKMKRAFYLIINQKERLYNDSGK